MAGSKSNYLESALLDHVYGGGNFTRPVTVYIALYTVAPSDAGGGTEVSGSDWTNYARVAVTNNATNWPAASGSPKANGTAFDFGVAAISNPVHVVAFGILDGAGANNLLHWGDLTAHRDIEDGDPVQFPIGALSITED